MTYRFETRLAVPADAERIVAMIQPAVASGAVLQRTVPDILDHIENFFVTEAFDAEANGELAGCVALRDFGNGLEEVRTLVVNDKFQGAGIGSMLIEACLELARSRHAKQIFALSLRPNLFVRKGFNHIPMERLPELVWKDDQVSSPDEKAVILIDFE